MGMVVTVTVMSAETAGWKIANVVSLQERLHDMARYPHDRQEEQDRRARSVGRTRGKEAANTQLLSFDAWTSWNRRMRSFTTVWIANALTRGTSVAGDNGREVSTQSSDVEGRV